MIEIGSADAAVILGVSSFSTPWRLWCEKLGLIERAPADEVMESGDKLEQVIVDMEASDLGALVIERRRTRYAPERCWQRSTADAEISTHDWRASVEIKCTVAQPPPVPRVEWVVQSLHHLMVNADAMSCRLVCFGGLRRESWDVPRHQPAMDLILREEEAFLSLVETQMPPPVRAADAAILARRWPWVREASVPLGPEFLDVDAQRETMLTARKRAQHAVDTSDAAIKNAIGEASEAMLPDGTKFTWRSDKRGVRALRRTSA